MEVNLEQLMGVNLEQLMGMNLEQLVMELVLVEVASDWESS